MIKELNARLIAETAIKNRTEFDKKIFDEVFKWDGDLSIEDTVDKLKYIVECYELKKFGQKLGKIK